MSHTFVQTHIKAISQVWRHTPPVDTDSESDGESDNDSDGDSTEAHIDMDTDPIPRETSHKTSGLVLSQVKEALALVKNRRRLASERYHALAKRYQSIPEEVRISNRLQTDQRQECHSEFASSGMYEGVFGLLGQQVEEAGGELAKGDPDGCFETLRTVMGILHPIEKKLKMWEKAMKAHEKVAGKNVKGSDAMEID